jgi:hypothetical protein
MVCRKTPIILSGLSKHTVTVADNLVSVGCEVCTIEDWLESAVYIGRNNDYTDREVSEYLSAFKYIQFQMKNYREKK